MVGSVKVARVEAGDLELLMKMANTRLREEYTLELFQHFFETQGGCFLTAKDGDEVVGFVLAVPMDNSSLRVLMLVVKGSKVRNGIGSALMSSAEVYASSRKMSSMLLEVGTNNEVALEFYKNLGYGIMGMIPEYYNDKTDAFVMRKYLPM
jgi:ribosomal protein S18 acetylase RimI-like enzyme